MGLVGVAVAEQVNADRAPSAFFYEVKPAGFFPRALGVGGEPVEENDWNRRFD